MAYRGRRPTAAAWWKTTDLYALLNVESDASDATIRKAFRRIALRIHPDKRPQHERPKAEEDFKKLAQVYAVLADATSRAAYDKYRAVRAEADTVADWPEAESCEDVSYLFFLHRVPGRSPVAAFSEAKLREMFPERFSNADTGASPGSPESGQDAASEPAAGHTDSREATRSGNATDSAASEHNKAADAGKHASVKSEAPRARL
mmetsp:Transcript_70615/g.169196  ORF Transcript_70615/g.169196 Transcript_70615/m.169196 type:complete len:205 (+) Transcript_70615:73-687(+)